MTPVEVEFNPEGHDGTTCDCPTRAEFGVAAYDQWGQRIATVVARTCGGDGAADPQFLATAQLHCWPGKTICVWRDHTVTPPERLNDARPDATAGGAAVSAVARVTLTDGKVTADSRIRVIRDGAIEVASGRVPEHGHSGGVSNRILSGLADLGWQAAGSECLFWPIPGGFELDVEPLIGGTP